MNAAKIAIHLDPKTLLLIDRMVRQGLYPSRNNAIQAAVKLHVLQINQHRLRRECAKLTPSAETALSDYGMAADVREWPDY